MLQKVFLLLCLFASLKPAYMQTNNPHCPYTTTPKGYLMTDVINKCFFSPVQSPPSYFNLLGYLVNNIRSIVSGVPNDGVVFLLDASFTDPWAEIVEPYVAQIVDYGLYNGGKGCTYAVLAYDIP